MTAAGDHELDAVRAHLAALRPDADTEAASAQLGLDLARIRADLVRLAESHAAAWRDLEPFITVQRGSASGGES
jgi:hypothetical protein